MSSKILNPVLMPCGCKIDKQSVVQYLQDVFEKNSYDYEIRCPRNRCKKTWIMSDIDEAIHLDDDVYEKYLQEIAKRSAPQPTSCPFCNNNCERPIQSTQYRVHCSCSKINVDWCWECRQRWRTEYIDDCGNSNCRLNNGDNNSEHFRQQDNDTNDINTVDMIGINNKSKFYVGQKVKSKDPSYTTQTIHYNAIIVKVEPDRVKVKYDNYPDDRYDQWINEHLYDDYIKIKANNNGNNNDNINDNIYGNAKQSTTFYVNQAVKARDPKFTEIKFYDAKITEVNYDMVNVKYDDWPNDSDDKWIHSYQYSTHIKIEVNDVQMSNRTNKANDTNDMNMAISNSKNDMNMTIPNSKTKFCVNQSVKARDPDNSSSRTFYNATIKEVKKNKVIVAYDGYTSAYNKTIKKKDYHSHIRLSGGSINGMTHKSKKNKMTSFNNGLVGLNNLGNTCFMNSALQCLLQCPDFIQLFLQDKIKLPQRYYKINKQSLAYIFSSFIKEIYTTNRNSIAPHNIKNALNKLNSQIGNGTQQDSFMVIETLLQGLEDELCMSNQDEMVHDLNVFNNKDIPNNKQISKKVNELWTQHINGSSNNDYSVRETFDGVECEKTSCCVCGYELRTFQTFRQIELPLCDKNISLKIKVYIPNIGSYSLCTETLSVTYDNTMDGLKYIMLPRLMNKCPQYKLNNTMNMKFGYINMSNNKNKSMNGWIKYMNKDDNCSKIKCHSQLFAVIYGNKPKNLKYIPQFNLICNEQNQFVRGVLEKNNKYGDDIITFTKVFYQKNHKGSFMNGKQIIAQESKVNEQLQNKLINYKEPIIFYNNHILNSTNDVSMVKNGCLLRIWVHKKLKKQTPASVSNVTFDKNDQSTIQYALNNQKNNNSWIDLDNICDAVGGYCRNLRDFTFYEIPNFYFFIPECSDENSNISKEIEEKRNQAQETHNKLKTLSEAEKLANAWLAKRLDCINQIYQKQNINYTKPKMLDDLDECLAVYESNETSNANLLDCQQCTDLPEIVSRQVDILKTPKILTIHIDREEDKDNDHDYHMVNNNGYYNNYGYGGSKKRNTLIKYKVNGLQFKGDIYDLFGAVEHYGYGTDSGHYAAHVKSLGDKKWYKMNDSSVSRIGGSPRVSNNVSVLLYKKRNQDKHCVVI